MKLASALSALLATTSLLSGAVDADKPRFHHRALGDSHNVDPDLPSGNHMSLPLKEENQMESYPENVEDATGSTKEESSPTDTQVITVTESPALSIPDGNPAGVSVSYDVAEDCVMDKVTIALGIDHDFAGDLILKLTSPNGTVVGLVNQIFNGMRSSNFAAANIITFDDESENDPQLLGSGLNTAQNIPASTVFSQGTFEGTMKLQDLSGEGSGGDWTLFASDNDNQNVGTLQTLELTITCVPPPPVGGACCAQGGCFDNDLITEATCADVLEGDFLGVDTTCGHAEWFHCKKMYVADKFLGN